MYRRVNFKFKRNIIVGSFRDYKVKDVLIITYESGDVCYIGYSDPLPQNVVERYNSKIQ